MPRESELEQAVSRLNIKCDAIEAIGKGRPTRAEMVALIFLARKVVTEYYATQPVEQTDKNGNPVSNE